MLSDYKYNHISYNELFNAIENDSTENKFKLLAELLMSAVNDWPTFNLKEPKDLITELRREIKEKLTFDNLERYLKKLKLHNDAWKMEAVTALLEMFEIDLELKNNKSIDLEMIVVKLTQHYRQK